MVRQKKSPGGTRGLSGLVACGGRPADVVDNNLTEQGIGGSNFDKFVILGSNRNLVHGSEVDVGREWDVAEVDFEMLIADLGIVGKDGDRGFTVIKEDSKFTGMSVSVPNVFGTVIPKCITYGITATGSSGIAP